MRISETSSGDDLRQMVNAYEVSRMLHIVATLGIADLLADGDKDVSGLASATSTHAPTLYRLLRALASVGVFVENGDGRFGLTPLAEFLRSDVQGSVHAWALMVGGPSFWSSWGELLESVRTGEAAFPRVHGMTNWEYRERHASEGAIFDTAMAADSRRIVDAIATGYDFSQLKVLVDVGGGHGVLLTAILAANPSLRGILFDQPHVLPDTAAIFNSSGVVDRVQIVGGDFFQRLPDNADAYMLKSILHDWDDEQAIRILKRCRQVTAVGAKLLVIELVLLPPNEPDLAKLVDMRMLVMNGGRERTADEFARLYAAAGFEFRQIIPTRSPLSIIEGFAV